MKYRYDPSHRSFQQPPLGGPGPGPFPGISDPFFGGGNMGFNQGAPFNPGQFQNPGPGAIVPLAETITEGVTAVPAKVGGFSLPTSLSDIKGIVDRMGGIEGIVSTMTKVQKVVGSITQMAPLIKVLAGSFGKKDADEEDDAAITRRRKRRRPRGAGSGSKRKRRPVSKKRKR